MGRGWKGGRIYCTDLLAKREIIAIWFDLQTRYIYTQCIIDEMKEGSW